MTDSRATDSLTSTPSHTLGFGCATLYGLPGRRERRAVLECAYDLGIRHFDVAPIYGLGYAEAELADFTHAHKDIRIVTKFGIKPTAVGRFAGFVQPPIRRVLQASAGVRSKVKQSGAAPDAGTVGRVLYSRGDYSVASAERALRSSLQALRTDRIDGFLLHEPDAVHADDYPDLVEYLETQRSRGVIGYWGPAGDLSRVDDVVVATLSARAPALQCPYDLIAGYRGPLPEPDRLTITFGVLGQALPEVIGLMSSRPEFRRQCSELLDADLGDPETAVKLLVRDAITHNRGGTVLVSSTKVKHLETACASGDTALRNEVQVANMIRDQFLGVGAER